MTYVLIDFSSIAYPLWHIHGGDVDPRKVADQILAKVMSLAHGQPHVAICVDSPTSKRKAIDPTYKANRPAREEALTHQMAVALDQLAADGFPIWMVDGYEADDVIASAVAALSAEGTPILVCTADKDLLQLADLSNVRIKSTRTGEELDAAGVKAKLGIEPDQVRDYLVLVGDASDNISGVKGIGPKRAVDLLTEYRSVAGLYAALDQRQTRGLTPAIVAALDAFRERVDTVTQLVDLTYDLPLPLDALRTPREPVSATLFLDADEPEDAMLTPEPAAEVMLEDAPAAPPPTPKAAAALVPVVEPAAPAPAKWELQLEPRSMTEAKTLAGMMHESRLFLGSYGHPAAILSTILAGRELGLQAMAALRGIHIVEGRPALSASLMVALILRSGLAEYFRPVSLSTESVTFETKRKGRGEKPITYTYTLDEARAAGLVKEKSGWAKNPQDMLVARASSKLARLVYPDLLFGLYTPEELRETAEASS